LVDCFIITLLSCKHICVYVENWSDREIETVIEAPFARLGYLAACSAINKVLGFRIYHEVVIDIIDSCCAWYTELYADTNKLVTTGQCVHGL